MSLDLDAYPARTLYQDARVAARYEAVRFAGLRGRLVNAAERRALGRVLRDLPAGGRVLDLPCGSGRMLDLLRGHRIVAADISWPMLRQARRRQPIAACVRCAAERLPFRDGAFDAIVSVRFFQHLGAAQRAAVLREMARVSRRIVFTASTPDFLVRARVALQRRLRRDTGPWLPVRPSEIARELEACGLRFERRLPVGRGWSPLHVVVASRAA